MHKTNGVVPQGKRLSHDFRFLFNIPAHLLSRVITLSHFIRESVITVTLANRNETVP